MSSYKKLKQHNPIQFLDEFRGTDFEGEWPTLPETFSITTKRFPSRACLTDWDTDDGSKRTYTYSEASEKILNLSQWLTENGIKKGDKIAVTGKNSPEWVVVYLAALFAGAIICPIDYALRESEQENLLRTAEPKFLFVDSEKFEYYNKKIATYRVFALNRKNPERYVFSLTPESNPNPKLGKIAAENDTAAILFTSGTTGNPKGVVLSHKNLVSDAYIAQTNMILSENDVFYALLPIHHAYTMLAVFIESISVGAEIVFGKSMATARLLKELKEGKITMLLGVPLLFNKFAAGITKGIKEKGLLVHGIMRFLMEISYLLKKMGINVGRALFKPILEKAGLSTIRIAICGGGPLAKSVFKFYNQLGIDFVQGYGLTETSPIIALNPIEHFKLESVGSYFAPHMEMKILNPNEDGIGEICVKGPMVMQGYYKKPGQIDKEETAKVFTEDGWFKTGDLGWLDDENYLMLSGRSKNMIVTSGGKNVYPEEIEDSFQLAGDIQQITVQGYKTGENGVSEEIEALIFPSDEAFKKLSLDKENLSENDKAAIHAHIKQIVEKINRNLQPYQKITRFTILEKPLEMTTTLKVKRNYK